MPVRRSHVFAAAAVMLATTSTALGQLGGPGGPPGGDPMAGVYAPAYSAPGGYYNASMLQPGAGGEMLGGPGQPLPMVDPDADFPAYVAPPGGWISARNGLFYAQVDSMWLQRSAPGNQPVGMFPSLGFAPGARPTLDLPSSQIGYTMTAAPRLTAGYQAREGSALEGSFYGWFYTRGQRELIVPARGPGAYGGFFATLFGTTGGAPVPLILDGSSKLFNGEINYFQAVGPISLMAGFRWMQLEDNFSVIRPVNLVTQTSNRYDIQAQNRLLGGQIGARAERELDLLTLSGTLKLGGYQDQVVVNQRARTSTGAIFRDSTTPNSRGVMESEAQVVASVLLNGNVSLRMGFDFWYLDGVCLAPDNVTAVETGNANRRGSVFFYGPSIGLDASF